MTRPAVPVRFAVRAYVALQAILPASLRRRHGPDMVTLFSQLAMDAHADGGIPRLARTWLAAVVDLGRGRRAVVQPVARRTAAAVMGSVWSDFRYGLRGLMRAPGLTLLAVGSLAIGMAVTVATFTFADHVLWQEWAFDEPEEVVQIFERDETHRLVSWANFQDIKEQTSLFDGVLASRLDMFSLGTADASQVVYGELVSADYFEVLGIQPGLGQLFSSDTSPTAESPLVVVVSHFLWTTALGSDPNVIGRPVRLNGNAATVVGVAPREFNGTKYGLGTDLWLPIRPWGRLEEWGDWERQRVGMALTVMARLPDGVALSTANATLAVLAARLAEAHPSTNHGVTFLAFDRLLGDMGPEMGGFPDLIGVLAIGAALLVLLVGCGNAASLMLARGVVRRREIALRLALGAGRRRVFRQLLVESSILAVLAAGVGVGLAFVATDFFPRFLPRFAFRLVVDTDPGARALVVTAGLAMLAAVLSGVFPAFQTARTDIGTAMKAGGSGVARLPRMRLLNTVVVGMMALTFVALFLAGAFGRSLQHARRLEPGFATDGRIIATVPLQLAGYPYAETTAFFERLEERFAALPSVRQVAYGTSIPLGGSWSWIGVYADGRAHDIGDQGIRTWRSHVSDGYFDAIGTRIVRGRAFGAADGVDGPWAAIVNEELAARLWPGEDPVGRRIVFSLDSEAEPIEIVGVAETGMYYQAGEAPEPAVYVSFRQWPQSQAMVVLDVDSDPAALVPAMRAALNDLDPDVPLHDARTMTDHARDSLWLFRLGAGLGQALSLLALLLAAGGIYGVMTFAVGARRHELGVRLALGASREQVFALVLRSTLRLVAIGAAIGLFLAFAVSEGLRALLVGVSPRDPIAIVVGCALLAVAGVLAGLAPAFSASRSDPIQSLKVEQ